MRQEDQLNTSKKRKRRKKQDDLSYRPGQKNSRKRKKTKNSDYLLKIRTNHDDTVTVEDEVVLPKKTSMMLKDPGFTSPQIRDFKKRLSNKLTQHPYHRPIEKVIKTTSSGSPLVIETPGKSVLNRSRRMGFIYFFDNQLTSPNLTPEKKKLSGDSLFFKSSPYEAIQSKKVPKKYQTIDISTKLLNASKQKIKRNNNQRQISQNKVMVNTGVKESKGSATQYVKATQLFDPHTKQEWLHLVAHRILATAAQHVDNLVSGTPHANTEMMMVEDCLEYLSKAYPEGFKLTVEADLIEQTHIAHSIQFTIETEDFILPFSFNAQQSLIPNFQDVLYVRSVIESLLEVVQQEEEYEEDDNLIDNIKRVLF
ncbi:MAG: hypothetical protein HYX60_03220 [Legionella longbeachae]|nr:hypothetical protein [Legionella longbeachae]